MPYEDDYKMWLEKALIGMNPDWVCDEMYDTEFTHDWCYKYCGKDDLYITPKCLHMYYHHIVRADRKTESSSEKPNNCEKDCFLCKWLGDVDVCGRCRNRNLFAEADTEPTISRMEQVEDEPQACDNCKLKGSTKWCNNQVVCRAYKPIDEPQTEPLHTCSVNGRPYSECSSCEHFKCTADEPQTERSE